MVRMLPQETGVAIPSKTNERDHGEEVVIMNVRILKIERGVFAVLHDGVGAGTVRRQTMGLKRMWLADGANGAQGVFPSKKVAAEWLVQRA